MTSAVHDCQQLSMVVSFLARRRKHAFGQKLPFMADTQLTSDAIQP